MKKTCTICKREFSTKQGLSRYWRDNHFNLCSNECERKNMIAIKAKMGLISIKENV